MSLTDVIIGCISTGEENAVSLAELCQRTNEAERTVRLCTDKLFSRFQGFKFSEIAKEE